MTQKFSLNVNGKVQTVEADADMPLLYALRNDLGLNNPHFGCGLAQCGACTVHVDGKPTRSCVTPLSDVGDRKIVTLAGLGTPDHPHPLQTAYVEEEVPQCGYCINGWIMTAAAFLRDNKKPTDAEIRDALDRAEMPLRHPHGDHARGQARRRDDGLREAVMTRHEKPQPSPAAACCKAGGALVVSIGVPVDVRIRARRRRRRSRRRPSRR